MTLDATHCKPCSRIKDALEQGASGHRVPRLLRQPPVPERGAAAGHGLSGAEGISTPGSRWVDTQLRHATYTPHPGRRFPEHDGWYFDPASRRGPRSTRAAASTTGRSSPRGGPRTSQTHPGRPESCERVLNAGRRVSEALPSRPAVRSRSSEATTRISSPSCSCRRIAEAR